jgi:hypothetical protein
MAFFSMPDNWKIGKRLVAQINIPLWKEAQQEVRQHWFIDSYIAAYIQMQYRVGGVQPTGLTVARGVRRCPQGSPRALASAREEKRYSVQYKGYNLIGVNTVEGGTTRGTTALVY